MKIATFNINNINNRLPNLRRWLRDARPDIVCLQELKCADEAFPAEALEDQGYAAVWQGQRTWNGVPILSASGKPVLTRDRLPGDSSDALEELSRCAESPLHAVAFGATAVLIFRCS